MKNKQNLITLLTSMLLTNSLSDRLNILNDFFWAEKELFSDTDRTNIINLYTAARDAKKMQGKTDAQRAWAKKKNNKVSGIFKTKLLKPTEPETTEGDPNTDWLFIEKTTFPQYCHNCLDRYTAGESVFVRRSDNAGFHIKCTSQIIKDNNTFYARCLEKKAAK